MVLRLGSLSLGDVRRPPAAADAKAVLIAVPSKIRMVETALATFEEQRSRDGRYAER